MTPDAPSHRSEPPLIVIDSNVVLDWLLFRDAHTAALDRAIRDGHVAWIATAAMISEHRRVFKHDVALARGADPLAFESAWTQWGRFDPVEPRSCGLRCTDPDDQVFIDFAVACQAKWLLTRDRALLKLSRRARDRGLVVLRPVDWPARVEMPAGGHRHRGPP